MIRVTNKSDQASHVVYVDRPVIQEVEKQVISEPQIQFVEKEVIKEVPVEVEKVVVQKEIEKVDLSIIHTVLKNHEQVLKNCIIDIQNSAKNEQLIVQELEMQRRALVAIKMQRDVDRSRRLTLIRRIKKERDLHKNKSLKLKLAIGASLILSIVSLIVKL
jgi:hypothetical protein